MLAADRGVEFRDGEEEIGLFRGRDDRLRRRRGKATRATAERSGPDGTGRPPAERSRPAALPAFRTFCVPALVGPEQLRDRAPRTRSATMEPRALLRAEPCQDHDGRGDLTRVVHRDDRQRGVRSAGRATEFADGRRSAAGRGAPSAAEGPPGRNRRLLSGRHSAGPGRQERPRYRHGGGAGPRSVRGRSRCRARSPTRRSGR